MKVEFLVNVKDKYTEERYEKNQVVDFKKERAKEILKAKRKNGQPYATEVKEEAIETATKKVKSETAVKKTRKKKSIEIDLDKGTVKENDL